MPTSDTQLMLSISADTTAVKRQLRALMEDAKKAGKGLGDALNPPSGGAANTNIQRAAKSTQQLAAESKVLSFQLNDIATGLSTGQSPFMIMNQQLGQVMQSLSGQGLVGSLGLLKSAFMTSFPALAVMGLVTAFQMLTAESEDNEKAIKKANEALRDQQSLVDQLRKLQGLEGVDRDRSQVELFVKTREAMAKNVEIAGQLVDKLNEIRRAIDAMPASAFEGQTYTIQQLDGALNNLAEGIKNGDADFLAFAKRLQELEKLPLPAKIKQLVQQIIDLAGNAALSAENLQDLRDALSGVAKEQDKFNDALKVLDEFAKTHLSDLDKIIEAYRIAMQGARTLSEAMGITAQAMQAMANTQQAAGQAGSAVDLAEQLIGVSENVDPARINAFLKQGGVDLDAAATAWCAAFVNSALQQMGIKGSGSNVATSFLNWGVKVDEGQIRRGDVLVQPKGRGAGQTGGHVGFATGAERMVDGFRQIEMISGNSADKVTKTWVNAADVVARRGADVTPLADQGKGAVDAMRDARKAAEDAAAAEAKLAEARKKGQEAYEASVEAQQKSLDQQLSENQILTDTSLTLDQKTLKIEANRIATELNTAAEKNGIEVTEELRRKHEALAMSMAQAKLANDNIAASQKDLAKQQEETRRQMEQLNQQFANIAKSAIGGLVNDLRNGVEAGEAFANMLDRVVDGLINMALEALFSKNMLGGLFGGIGGIGGGVAGVTAHGGGTIGISGRRDGRKFSPALWAGAQRFHSGGIVGLRPGEVPIIAQRGEIVVPNARRLAGSGTGRVDNSVHQDNKISIDMTGSGYVAANSEGAKQVGANIQKMIQAELVYQSRPGGLLRKVPA